MGLKDHVETLIREEADGTLKALHAIAEHVDKFGSWQGGPARAADTDLEAFKAEFKGQADAFMATLARQVEDARDAFAARLDSIEAAIAAAKAAPTGESADGVSASQEQAPA